MSATQPTPTAEPTETPTYRLTDQVGHMLRRAFQRHSTIFASNMVEGLTATRFAALVMLQERGGLSQNELGRSTAMDIATVTGVVRWLKKQGLVSVEPYPNDARRNLISLSERGANVLRAAIPLGVEISTETLAPLTPSEAAEFIALLRRLG
ncbi:MAG: MarR family winged helix-turn-helix transcriptional regulator [Hyphomicrobiaceae bacterium]